jgi:hypothetical protein
MGTDDDRFWDVLLNQIEDERLVPVLGSDLSVVNVGQTEQTLSSLIGQRLASQYQLSTPSEIGSTGEAVRAILQRDGRDQVELLYGDINRIIEKINPAPGKALRDLAAIDELRLLVSLTPDRLLAQALNEVRFQGRPQTCEYEFSLTKSTSEQAALNNQPAASTDTVVLNLFGRASRTGQYVIHEEDEIEWLHALLTDTARLPQWLGQKLKQQHTLFIGWEIPDWIGPFMMRASSTARLSDEKKKQFFFVGSSTQVSKLSNFFATYCRRPLVQEMEPNRFVAELRERWEQRRSVTPPAPSTPPATPTPFGAADPAPPKAPEIFLSYMREDAEAAQRLVRAIGELGGNVWMDKLRIHAGGPWEQETLNAIHRSRLFVPVISANTEREEVGFVFREWNAAVDQSLSIMGRSFIVPVIIDNDYDGDLGRYRRMPPDFRRLNFGHAPAGVPDASLVASLRAEIRDMRRPGAA